MPNFLLKLATLGPIGKIGKMPGTIGTVAALPLALGLMYLGPVVYIAFTVLLLPVSILSSELYERHSGEHDLSEVIIDEVLGLLITMALLPMTWQSFVIGFLLFRFFDILKPFPISWLDKNIKGGVGVVVDDVAAGVIANIILHLIYAKTLWLGVQVISS